MLLFNPLTPERYDNVSGCGISTWSDTAIESPYNEYTIMIQTCALLASDRVHKRIIKLSNLTERLNAYYKLQQTLCVSL